MLVDRGNMHGINNYAHIHMFTLTMVTSIHLLRIITQSESRKIIIGIYFQPKWMKKILVRGKKALLLRSSTTNSNLSLKLV